MSNANNQQVLTVKQGLQAAAEPIKIRYCLYARKSSEPLGAHYRKLAELGRI